LSRKAQKKKGAAGKPQQSGRSRTLLFVGLVLVVVIVGLYVFSQPSRAPGGAGDVAPDFGLRVVTAEGLTDQTAHLSDYRGKVVVLEFMVSWCHVCQEMEPSIVSLQHKYSGQDVVFLSVAGTQRNATAESTAAFIREFDATWTHVLDSDNSAFSAYGVNATPTYFVLDKSGKILSRFEGVVITDAFYKAIDAALSA
jgi:thiol-disulfide isomerase/thioredoxin